MIVEALESYAKMTNPWLQALSAANAMSISATRIAVGQMELAALSTRFINERLCAYAGFDGGVEPLVQRLEKLTDQYSENYAAQLKTIYAPWSDFLREDRPLAEVVSMTADRDDAKEAKEGKRQGGPREVRPEKGREPAAH
jgi:hypothetical protein